MITNRVENISQQDLVTLWQECETQDSFILYDPRLNTWYLGMQDKSRVDLPVNEDIRGFLAQTFFGHEPSKIWHGFKSGVIRYPYNYAVKADLNFEAVAAKNIEIRKESYALWENIFDLIQDGISTGELKKVVASRCVEINSQSELKAAEILANLYHQNINSYFFCYRSQNKAFIGATPEILIEKNGEKILSYALAGTVKKTSDDISEIAAEFLQDEKNVKEHKIVVEAIVEGMQEFSDKIEVGEMHVLELANMLHLKTDIIAHDEQIPAEDWVNLLHPTPAMGGSPKEKSLALLAKYEPYDRGFYASPLGVLSKNGDALVVVGIRSALVEGHKAYAFAGCGIVAQSDCQKEYEEIDTKLKTIVEAL